MSISTGGKGAATGQAPEKGNRALLVAGALALGIVFVVSLALSAAAVAQGNYSQPQADRPEEQMTQVPTPAATPAEDAPSAPAYSGQQYTQASPTASVAAEAQYRQGTAVSIQDFYFAPARISVTAGTTVTWTNDGQAPHTVTADDGSFDSGTLQPGESYSFTFTEPGTFSYFCEIHPSMTGSVVVEGVAAPAQQVTGTRDHSLPATGGPSLPVAGTVLLLGFGLACCAAMWRIQREETRRKSA